MKVVNPNHQYFMEFIGLFFLVLTIENAAGKELGAFGIGVVFFVMVFITAPVSGAHLNPAVTFFCYLNDSAKNPNTSNEKYIHYVFYQCLGAIAASWVSSFFGGHVIDLAISEEVTHGIGFLFELVFTCILCFTAGNIGASKTIAPEAGMAVGGVIFIGAISIGPFTGAVVNPAIGTGLIVGRALFVGGNDVSQLWIYILAPLLAAYFAHVLHLKYQNPNLTEEVVEEPKVERIQADDA